VDKGPYEFGAGDVNCDRSIDLIDFAQWFACVTGPGELLSETSCEGLDIDADLDIDLRDLAAFQREYLGPTK
ncbi:MAG: hypothetical protein AABZ47_00270, partial [Planctomycetota bacterium]